MHIFPEATDFFSNRFRFAAVALLLVAALAPGGRLLAGAPSAFLIALKELPEWAPGGVLTVRHVIVDDRGAGQVVTTREDGGRTQVLRTGSLPRQIGNPPAELGRWVQKHEELKTFYGFDEDADPGLTIEGHPQKVVFSFFRDGRLNKKVSLSGDMAYTRTPGGKYRIPAALIDLMDALFAYADEATSETRAAYYVRMVPYTAAATDWLLKSVKMQDIPVIANRIADHDRRFLEEVRGRMPTFFPLDEGRFTRIRKALGLSGGRQRAAFRASRDDEVIVQVRFMDGAVAQRGRRPSQ